jgi:branched-chain amino acid transport system ATP-binding protein
MSVLLVEQNAVKALSISDRAYVMQNGSIVHSGAADAMLQDDNLRKAYLGM